jgi:hypothetical protein
VNNAESADSDEVARLYRDDVAHRSEMISPMCEPRLAVDLVTLMVGFGQSSY